MARPPLTGDRSSSCDGVAGEQGALAAGSGWPVKHRGAVEVRRGRWPLGCGLRCSGLYRGARRPGDRVDRDLGHRRCLTGMETAQRPGSEDAGARAARCRPGALSHRTRACAACARRCSRRISVRALVQSTCRCGEPHGKPELRGYTAPSFSLTHSGKLVGVAVRPDAPVGLDVEQVRELTDLSAMGFARELSSRACPEWRPGRSPRFLHHLDAQGGPAGS